MRIAVTGREPPLAVATKCTGEPVAVPFAGEVMETVCAKPIADKARKPTKSLIMFFNLKLLIWFFIRSQAKDASTLDESGEHLELPLKRAYLSCLPIYLGKLRRRAYAERKQKAVRRQRDFPGCPDKSIVINGLFLREIFRAARRYSLQSNKRWEQTYQPLKVSSLQKGPFWMKLAMSSHAWVRGWRQPH